MTSRLPVELWQEIISDVLASRLVPHQGATLFDDMDVFVHPCKINHFLVSARAPLRLVCRLWDEIIRHESDRKYCAFEEATSSGLFDLNTVRHAYRLEFLESRESYCLKSPCRPNSQRIDRCAPSVPRCVDIKEQRGQIMVRGDCPMKVRVVRLQKDIRDPTKLLQYCKNLKALSIRFANFSTLDKTTVLPIVQSHLSHLHLSQVYDDGTTHALNLPHLHYIELHLKLIQRHSDLPFFPLDIHMPGVVTIYIWGSVGNEYTDSVEKFIISSKETLVNLVLPYNIRDGNQVFPLENLSQFPRLSTFGFSIPNLRHSLPEAFCIRPLPNTSSLTLLLLGLKGHSQQPQWVHRRTYAERCVEMFTRPGGWFSGISIAFDWNELEDVWVRACETYDGREGFLKGGREDPLPCYWSVLEQIDRNGISIRDRNGVGLWEGDGAKFAQRMKTFAESDQYTDHELGNAAPKS